MHMKTSISLFDKLLAALCALVMCATLAACNGGDQSDDSKDSNGSGDSSQSSADALKDLPPDRRTGGRGRARAEADDQIPCPDER